jgi:nucleoside-diphosphate-sugar epimerase
MALAVLKAAVLFFLVTVIQVSIVSSIGILGGSPDLVLVNVRDRARLKEVMREIRPDVVFHAAALKHLPLLEANPAEALKTNVIGTLNVLEARPTSASSASSTSRPTRRPNPATCSATRSASPRASPPTSPTASPAPT